MSFELGVGDIATVIGDRAQTYHGLESGTKGTIESVSIEPEVGKVYLLLIPGGIKRYVGADDLV